MQAEARVDARSTTRPIAERDALRAQLATAQRNAQVAQSQLRIADQDVDNTVVRAPFAGVVIAKAAQPGEIVSPLSAGGGFTRTGIGTIVDMDSLEVEVEVGEAFIGRVQPKMPVEATLNAYPDWKIPAEVIAIIPAADRGKATVKVRIALKVKDPRIVPDMGVRVSFLEPARPAPAVAERARRARARRGDRLARWQGRRLRRRRRQSLATRAQARSQAWAMTARCSMASPAATPWCSIRPRTWPTASACVSPLRPTPPPQATDRLDPPLIEV